MLRRIHSDSDNLFHGRPPSIEISTTLILAHCDAVRGSSTPTIFRSFALPRLNTLAK
jgi:hypothetical protein